MNRDFVEMLSAFIDARAEFLVVGAHALAAHGVPRATGDLNIWVRPDPANAARVLDALERFGAPLHELTAEDLIRPGLVFQIGVVPRRIDILTSIDGVDFGEAWKGRLRVSLEGLDVPILGLAQFRANKKAVGRPKDLADLALLDAQDPA